MQQIALVTGAADGLGKIIASELLNAGYRVAISDINKDLADSTAKQFIEQDQATPDQIMSIELDISQKDHYSKALDRIIAHWGSLHVVVNNAAMTQATAVLAISPEEFDAVTIVNQRGTFLSCQFFGQYLASQGYGRIINIASLAGQNGGTATGAHYAASKGAIITLTKIFAKEFAAQGVTVNAVSPGPIDSPAVRKVVPEEQLEKIVQMIPVKKLGEASFIGKTVALLASPDAQFTTGATWDINGGLFMR